MSLGHGLLNIPKLSGENYRSWNEDLEVYLCLRDLDLCLREPKPADLTPANTWAEKTELEKWETANRKCLKVIKHAIPETMKDSITMKVTATEYLEAIRVKFESSKKAQSGDLMSKLTTTKFDGNDSTREHLLGLVALGNKIRELEINFDDDFLVTIALNSLPGQYKHLHGTYNALKDKWSMDESITVVGQEEARMNRDKIESANLTQGKGSSSRGPHRNHKRFSKRGRFAPYRTGLGRGFTSRRVPSKSEVTVFVGNGAEVEVKAIGTVRLYLKSDSTNNFIDLKDVVFIPSMRKNLISVFRLVSDGYSVVFNKVGFTLLLNSVVVDSGYCSDGLYRLNCISSWVMNVGTKRQLMDEKSPGKMTSSTKKDAFRHSEALDLIHIDICRPFPTPALGGQRYFITFIDEWSRYGYIFLLAEKANVLNTFMIFKAEVELFHSRKIKSVRSDRGGEYYGRVDDTGQLLGPFAKYLQEQGIAPQYSMPSTP
ncbi:uncharacterized protein LOC122643627 [Telopea speciosissima]|uniref:uncharacterized protein LOC122643627 n=1 Tax=Telopea speciosissima TaxID=54955 RepID=UPI001CC4368E|nr:uncharacterized protein LOC122643627 [Telopea speciosissima]